MGKTVLYIVGEYPCVTETFIHREIVGLRRMGLNIIVVPVHARPLLLSSLRETAIQPRLWKSWRSLCNPLQVVSLRRCTGAVLRSALLAQTLPDVHHIHAHFLGLPATVAYSLSQLIERPYSLTAHAHDIYAEYTPAVVLQKAAFRTTCTEVNAAYLNARYPDAPFRLIRHGINLSQFAARRTRPADKPCHILAIGRLVEKKGFGFLLQACACLQERGFEYRCTIIGEGQLDQALLRAIGRHGLQKSVTLAPFRPHAQLVEEYRNADVLVVPSIITDGGDRDGVPNVILEAMACRLPVVASDAGSISEAVRHGTTGLLVPQRDFAAIADAICQIHENDSVATQLADNALEYIHREFEEEAWLKRLVGLFSDYN